MSFLAPNVTDADGRTRQYRGVVVVRHAAADETAQEKGCQRSNEEAATTERLPFEKIFLWVTGKTGTVETVQDMFGGADAIRKYARRRSGRAGCFAKLGDDENNTESSTEGPARDDQRGSLRKRRSVEGKPISSLERATRCLENHLREYPQDVQAAFALEMVLRALDGKSVDHQVKLLRDKIYAEGGQSGISLWKELHARTAVAAATELLS